MGTVPFYFLRNFSLHIATAFLAIFLYRAFSEGYVEKLLYVLQHSPVKAVIFCIASLFVIGINIYFFLEYSKQEKLRKKTYNEFLLSVKNKPGFK